MYDRILRSEVWDSGRFQKLPSDSHRLLYIALLNRADDFGNFEVDSHPMFNWARSFTQLKTEQDLVGAMSLMCDLDLLRRYSVADKVYFHIPRFRNSRTYWTRKVPPSPWCKPDAYTGPFKAERKTYRMTNEEKQQLATISESGPDRSESGLNQIRSDLKIGVGVGVGVGVGEHIRPTTRSKRRRSDLIEPGSGWSDFYEAYPRKEAKADAIAVWNRLKPSSELLAAILVDIAKRLELQLWSKADMRHIPLPATYLNAKRWEDELEQPHEYLMRGRLI